MDIPGPTTPPDTFRDAYNREAVVHKLSGLRVARSVPLISMTGFVSLTHKLIITKFRPAIAASSWHLFPMFMAHKKFVCFDD